MAEKTCFCCGKTKPLTDYYKHPKMADGHLGKCKECQKAATRANREENIEYYRDYDKSRAMLPHRVKARLDYLETDDGKKARKRAASNYRCKHPKARAAHIIVGNAVRDGILIRPQAYESCGYTGKIEGHHDDYTKPLSVTWLCIPCHKAWHRTNSPIFG